MGSLKLFPQIGVPPSEPKALTNCSWLNSLSIDQSTPWKDTADHAEREQPDLVAFLLSGQSISVEVVGYAIQHLLHMTAGGWGGTACLHLADSSIIDTDIGLNGIDSLLL